MFRRKFSVVQDSVPRVEGLEKGLAVLIAIAVLGVPFLLDGFLLYQLTNAAIMALAILGLNLLCGFSGQVSLGQGAFVAIGAYSTAVAIKLLGFDAYSAIAFAALVGFASGFAFGWPALRLGFVQLTLVTYGLAVVLPRFLKSDLMAPITGGVQGIYVDRPDPPEFFPGSEDQWWYYLTVITLGFAMLAVHNILNSRSGRALVAVRQSEPGAQSCGINIARYKTIAFGLAAMLAALAGGFSAVLADFVAPDQFTPQMSFLFLIGAVVGGLHSIMGALLGGLLLQYLPDLAGLVTQSLTIPSTGLILIVMIWLWPEGLMGRYHAYRAQQRAARERTGNSSNAQ